MATSKLQKIKGLGAGTIELLEAVGVDSPVDLAASHTQELYQEMEQANGHLSLLKKLPSESVVASWVQEAQVMIDDEVQPAIPAKASAGEKKASHERKDLVSVPALPVALAVKKEQIIKNKIAVADVPIMERFLEEDELTRELVEEFKAPEPERVEPRERSPKAAQLSKLKPLDKVDSFAMGEDLQRKVAPLKKNQDFDIRKTATPELNEGKQLHSRSYVRGVLHPRPGQVKGAAVITLITMLLVPLTVIAAGLVLFRDSLPIEIPLLPLAVVPALLLIFSFLYLIMVKPLKCRICGQPLLSSKKCFRHVKAHRFPLLGYILPTSLHMLLFHWFRCIYCGTSVRLKK